MKSFGKVLEPINTENLSHPHREDEYLENRGNHWEKISYFSDMYFRNPKCELRLCFRSFLHLLKTWNLNIDIWKHHDKEN